MSPKIPGAHPGQQRRLPQAQQVHRLRRPLLPRLLLTKEKTKKRILVVWLTLTFLLPLFSLLEVTDLILNFQGDLTSDLEDADFLSLVEGIQRDPHPKGIAARVGHCRISFSPLRARVSSVFLAKYRPCYVNGLSVIDNYRKWPRV